jgi:hypothetical protein
METMPKCANFDSKLIEHELFEIEKDLIHNQNIFACKKRLQKLREFLGEYCSV